LPEGLSVTGASLRRQYYQAEEMLEREDYGAADKLKKMGCRSRHMPPETETLRGLWETMLSLYETTLSAG